MEKNNLIIALLILVVGLFGGYTFGVNSSQGQKNVEMEEKHDEMMNHSYGDEVMDGDGAMMHAMDEMMRGFRGKTGLEYEEAFLKGMIVHHIGAIEMAEGLLEQTERPELVEMANDIINAQEREVEMMSAWLDEWFK